MASEQPAIKILAVDDSHEGLFALEQLLISKGFEVVTAANGVETLDKAESERPDLILLDVVMPEPNGLEVAKMLKANPELRYIPVVLLTGKDELKDIIKGFEYGADDYICKPYQSAELVARVHAALRVRRLYSQLREQRVVNRHLQARLREEFAFESIIGRSAAMRSLYEVMAKVVDSEVPVLILGESGTGKEVIATALHAHGPRKDKALVVQNCSAFNENLLESELFGHVKGAFTGAVRDKQGLFEIADGGTFFLDELGEMSPALQVKLLRVLQDGTFLPVGGTKQKKVNVRIIAATNRNVEKVKFRQDLYYRLNVVSLTLPALRERGGDIPLLVGSFLEKIAHKTGQSVKAISEDAMRALESYTWPGNIRQLENEIQRAYVMSGREMEIQTCHLSKNVFDSPSIGSFSVVDGEGRGRHLKDVLDRVEREMIQEALSRCEGNKSEAARQLGISRSNLIAKAQEYGLE